MFMANLSSTWAFDVFMFSDLKDLWALNRKIRQLTSYFRSMLMKLMGTT